MVKYLFDVETSRDIKFMVVELVDRIRLTLLFMFYVGVELKQLKSRFISAAIRDHLPITEM